MKKKILSIIFGITLMLSGCSCDYKDDNTFTNPGDYLGGGKSSSAPSGTETSELETKINDSIDTSDLTTLSANIDYSSALTYSGGTITSGNYILTGDISEPVVVSANNNATIHLYLNNVIISVSGDIAISNTNKKSNLIITIVENTTNTITNDGENNAIHVKGNLSINGSGTLNIDGGKNAIKVSKKLEIVDAKLVITSNNHAISANKIVAKDTNIRVNIATKDGLNAECDDDISEFTLEEGYIYLDNVVYYYSGYGDGIQADTFIVINDGNYTINTIAVFVSKTSKNMSDYDLENDDFRYIKSGSSYQKIASDNRSNSTLYAMTVSNKGIKVGEISCLDSDNNEVKVTDGDYVIIINGGEFNIDSDDDAIHANSGNILINGGEFNLSTLDDGITADELLQIDNSTINISTCYEGLEGGQIQIDGENTLIDIVSSDDGINAASDVNMSNHIIINNGKITVNSSGDGLDSNGTILINGGELYVYGPTSSADAALDSENGIIINGGIVVALGSLGMVETPSTSSGQYIISFASRSSISANTNLTLIDNDGNEILLITTKKACQSIIISTPQLALNSTYKIYGGSTMLTSFKISSKITSVGTSNTSSNPGGFAPNIQRR